MVKRTVFGAMTLVLACMIVSATARPGSQQDQESNRKKRIINTDWKYYSGEATGSPEQSSYDDSKWHSVNVPHCFNIPWWINDRVNFGGTGWYRKHFTLEGQDSLRQVFVEFEGVFLHCWVYINGTLVGEHKGGYTGFSYDITKLVNVKRADNVLAVKVSSNSDATIAPQAGDHIFTGGIYRDVYLVTTDPFHVQFNGMYVTTPFGGSHTSSAGYTLPTSFAKAPVQMQLEIKNSYSVMRSCFVRMEVFDADSQSLLSTVVFRDIDSGAVDTVIQMFPDSLESPHLWSPSDPYLYRASAQVWIGCDVVDQYDTYFGIRWFQSTANDGFYLNGKKLYLRGFNVHQDHAGWATAVTNTGHVRDVKLCKETGAQFIRGSHYPKDPAFVGACDSIGVCLMMEMCYWGKGGGTGANASPASGTADFTAFKQNCIEQTAEMVRSFRNNPSVIFWSLTNEPTGGALNCDDLTATVKAQDSTRPTCVVTNFVENNLHGSEDITALNGTAPTQGAKPSLWAELSDTAEASRPGSYSAVSDNEASYLLGTARWAAFDYGTHEDWMTSQGKPLNMVGMCDNYRIPKRRYYYLRNLWLGIAPPTWPQQGTPATLSLSADKTTILNNGTDDCQLMITVQDAQNNHISNNVNVKLAVTSGYGMFPTGDTIALAAVDGLAAIEFRSYKAGVTTITAIGNGVAPDTITIMVIDELSTPINPFSLSNKGLSGRPQLFLKGGVISGSVMKIMYRIDGDFSLSKKPVLDIYTLDGRLIEHIHLKQRSGMIQFGKSEMRSIPAGVFIYRLTYDNRAAVIKNILLH